MIQSTKKGLVYAWQKTRVHSLNNVQKYPVDNPATLSRLRSEHGRELLTDE